MRQASAGAALNGPSGNRLRFEPPRKRPFPLGVRSVYTLNLPTRLPEDPALIDCFRGLSEHLEFRSREVEC